MDNSAGSICYRKITIQGIVQGVGFRPYIARLAQKFDIAGTVKNTGGAVEIYACGTKANVTSLIEEIRSNAVHFAHIEKMEVMEEDYFFADQFEIGDSEKHSSYGRFVSPDLAVCEQCILEIEDGGDRRYHHPFNTCVSCGPRFSVMESLPYDRENTSMGSFNMCGACLREYRSSHNRRFHGETISCNDCGPYLIYRTNQETYVRKEAFLQGMDTLKNSGIIAIKGIGGYHLACSPFDSHAVVSLRDLKGRDKKPFAVMFRDLAEIKKRCEVSFEEQELLQSNPRPITLVYLKSDCLEADPFAPEVLFGDLRCGCFLPYTSLHHMIMEQMGLLVMTSANISGSSIIKDDDEMIRLLSHAGGKLRGVLYHERKIVRSVEDSVANMIDKNRAQVIRRARGYAPTPFYMENKSKYSLLAMGGDLKASFCFVKNNLAYLSQYLGDLEELSVNKVYTSSINDYKTLFDVQPEFILCDRHPLYVSTHHAKNFGLPVIFVQHHHAHIASVMAEHTIKGKVIGVAFDGSGYGTDGHIWGGEFFICEGPAYQRAAHMEYTKILGGDSAAIDAKKTADCFLLSHGVDGIEAFDDRMDVIKLALDNHINRTQSSSMGRLFDAVASIAGVCDENSYEGQCAAYLQRSAEKAYQDKIKPCFMEFDIVEKNDEILICHHDIMKRIYEQSYLSGNKNKGAYALGFHIAVADMIHKVCVVLREREGINQVALSGGVFQNSFLVHLCLNLLNGNGFQTFINHLTPPNDGSLSLGQAYIGSNITNLKEEAISHVHRGSHESDGN